MRFHLATHTGTVVNVGIVCFRNLPFNIFGLRSGKGDCSCGERNCGKEGLQRSR